MAKSLKVKLIKGRKSDKERKHVYLPIPNDLQEKIEDYIGKNKIEDARNSIRACAKRIIESEKSNITKECKDFTIEQEIQQMIKFAKQAKEGTDIRNYQSKLEKIKAGVKELFEGKYFFESRYGNTGLYGKITKVEFRKNKGWGGFGRCPDEVHITYDGFGDAIYGSCSKSNAMNFFHENKIFLYLENILKYEGMKFITEKEYNEKKKAAIKTAKAYVGEK